MPKSEQGKNESATTHDRRHVGGLWRVITPTVARRIPSSNIPEPRYTGLLIRSVVEPTRQKVFASDSLQRLSSHSS